MDARDEADRDTRSEDPALEEIRRLFARYRRIARHANVTERLEPEPEEDEPSPAVTATSTRTK